MAVRHSAFRGGIVSAFAAVTSCAPAPARPPGDEPVHVDHRGSEPVAPPDRDAIDAELVAPGRLDHLVEVVLPDADAQREILELLKGRTERHAGRPLFEPIDYRTILPVMGGMSGADISESIRRALETKVHRAAEGAEPGSVSTDDLLVSIDAYKRVRGVVEKIRYGQYL